jgi:hypothetical protein
MKLAKRRSQQGRVRSALPKKKGFQRNKEKIMNSSKFVRSLVLLVLVVMFVVAPLATVFADPDPPPPPVGGIYPPLHAPSTDSTVGNSVSEFIILDL